VIVLVIILVIILVDRAFLIVNIFVFQNSLSFSMLKAFTSRASVQVASLESGTQRYGSFSIP